MPENEVWTTFKAKTHKLASCSSCLLACLGIRVSSFSSQRRTTHVTWPNTRRLKRCACMPSAPQKGLISELRLQNVSSSSSSKSWSSSWFSPLAFFKMIEKMWKHFSLSLYVTHNVTSLSFFHSVAVLFGWVSVAVYSPIKKLRNESFQIVLKIEILFAMKWLSSR